MGLSLSGLVTRLSLGQDRSPFVEALGSSGGELIRIRLVNIAAEQEALIIAYSHDLIGAIQVEVAREGHTPELQKLLLHNEILEPSRTLGSYGPFDDNQTTLTLVRDASNLFNSVFKNDKFAVRIGETAEDVMMLWKELHMMNNRCSAHYDSETCILSWQERENISGGILDYGVDTRTEYFLRLESPWSARLTGSGGELFNLSREDSPYFNRVFIGDDFNVELGDCEIHITMWWKTMRRMRTRCRGKIDSDSGTLSWQQYESIAGGPGYNVDTETTYSMFIDDMRDGSALAHSSSGKSFELRS
eukprot:TRINITY_DN29278_c0_g1_i1.p1 TRINITY_DN29278_c0_g1~~TRINITY_DN29278_c0_g1_i1.p1  ORF type:complete len:303 (-),score=33.41 TRINITY_DN29278_c0_g1_i1:639-1547(-)